MSNFTECAANSEMAAIRSAYARLAGQYDRWFGPILGHARRAAVSAANRHPGSDVLEVGVGTGLALPFYSPAKRITGIDMSSEMLQQARGRVTGLGLSNVIDLLEMDAQASRFPDSQFDLAVAMFVASVVPDPASLLRELRRVVKPGGTILFVNHFARERGPLGWAERRLARASARIGWHSDFRLEHMFAPADLATASMTTLRPFGLFRLVELQN